MTKGAIALVRHWQSDPERPTHPPYGGGGTRAGRPGPSTKGRVSRTWSQRSRRNMRFEFGALPWELLGRRPVMITLTYPGEWDLWVPDARALHKHRETLKERWRRRYGAPIGVWVTEFQKRGAPHLHVYLALPEEVGEEEYVGLQRRTINRKLLERRIGRYKARSELGAPKGEFAMWLRTAWWEVVGSELKAHHGRGVDIATAFFSDEAEAHANRTRVAEYFWRESGKWAQKNPPDGFGSLKFYGRWGRNQGFAPVVTKAEMDEQVGLELRRMLRRLMRVKMLESAKRTGRRVPRNAGRSRGRDGLTVFNVDGMAVAPRLMECAREVALQKASVGLPEDRVYGRIRPELVRAFSEIGLDDDPGPEWDAPDEGWCEMPRDDEDALAEAVIAAHEHEEAEMEAARDAWIDEQVRELRRAELRRAGGWAGSRTQGGRNGGRRRP